MNQHNEMTYGIITTMAECKKHHQMISKEFLANNGRIAALSEK